MSPNDLSDRISSIVGKAESGLSKTVTATQRHLLEKIQVLLNRLELDKDGLIKQSQYNRKLFQKVDRIFDQALKEAGYFDGLSKYTSAIPLVTKANEKYFDFILDSFTVDAQYIKSLQKSAIANIETLLANDGLELQLKAPLREILNRNVNSGAAFSDLLKEVRTFISGTSDVDGKLLRYSKQISRDTLFNFNRAMQESISQKSGLQFYLYSGGLMDDSRDFCVARAGKYFHRKEIESWPRMTWQGKRTGTTKSSIYIYLGGYSCTHQLIPVSEAIVPKDIIEKAEQKGYI